MTLHTSGALASAPSRYRKKPVEIDAIQWTGDNVVDALKFFDAGPATSAIVNINAPADRSQGYIDIPTLEGTMRASVGDWIIRGIEGELYPCKPGIFAATYEPVSDTA
jgi:hypothetical protein